MCQYVWLVICGEAETEAKQCKDIGGSWVKCCQLYIEALETPHWGPEGGYHAPSGRVIYTLHRSGACVPDPSDVIIVKEDGGQRAPSLFESIYFRRCNQVYTNVFGGTFAAVSGRREPTRAEILASDGMAIYKPLRPGRASSLSDYLLPVQ